MKIKIEKTLDHSAVVIPMTLITIYALFFDDIRVVAFSKNDDDYFYAITVLGMFMFTVEIIFASIGKEDYFLTFFFWLDVVSTISMIPDCGWIWNAIMGSG